MQSYPSSEYNNRIIEAINQRCIQERYVEASVSIAYLHNSIAKLEKKGVVKAFCLKLLSRVNRVDEMESNTIYEPDAGNSNSEENVIEALPVAMKLQKAIDASLRIPTDDSLSSSLKYELNIAEQTGKRGTLLEKVYRMLLTVPPPTSVEAERIFSSCALCIPMQQI